MEGEHGMNWTLRLDEIGRQRLRDLRKERQMSEHLPGGGHGEAALARTGAGYERLTRGGGRGRSGATSGGRGGPCRAGNDLRSSQEPPGADAARRAQLRALTSREAESWWNPKHWLIARPTDGRHGDRARGVGQLPPIGDAEPKEQKNERLCFSAAHFIRNLRPQEEMEHEVPGDEEQCVADGANRFRQTWRDAHLLHFFWRATLTTNSALTFMKRPGRSGPPAPAPT